MAKYGQAIYGTVKYGSDALYIFDRTQADLDNNTAKAYINYSDLNRIETRMSELAELLTNAGYPVIINCKTDWTRHTSEIDTIDIPTLTHLIRIHDNEETIISQYFTYPTTPKLPSSFEKLTIYGANNIERILWDIRRIIAGMQANYKECDTFYCGED